MEQTHLRRPAALWLAVTLLFGLAGTFVGLMPTVFAWALFREGELSFAQAMVRMVPYASLLLCPLLAWWMFLRRQYGLAIIIASPPILLWLIAMIIAQF